MGEKHILLTTTVNKKGQFDTTFLSLSKRYVTSW